MLEGLLTEANIIDYIDMRLVILLLCIGFLLKHFIAKFPNKAIPYLLMLLAVAYEEAKIDTLNVSSIMNAIIDAIICAAVAIGLHSSGKGLFNISGVGSVIKNLLSKSSSDEEPTEESEVIDDLEEDETYEE